MYSYIASCTCVAGQWRMSVLMSKNCNVQFVLFPLLQKPQEAFFFSVSGLGIDKLCVYVMQRKTLQCAPYSAVA